MVEVTVSTYHFPLVEAPRYTTVSLVVVLVVVLVLSNSLGTFSVLT